MAGQGHTPKCAKTPGLAIMGPNCNPKCFGSQRYHKIPLNRTVIMVSSYLRSQVLCPTPGNACPDPPAIDAKSPRKCEHSTDIVLAVGEGKQILKILRWLQHYEANRY
ncbi:hypothetical protein BTVI_131733 [Pitangus sulphuratus]|nr:hypothetical protein BTVI_131733 [Pitangus sulphuratus]